MSRVAQQHKDLFRKLSVEFWQCYISILYFSMSMLSSDLYCNKDGKRFDILKIVLAVFIVAIHTTPVEFGLRPIFRVAVPLFFIMTSYFFFLKQKQMHSKEEKKKGLLGFVKRYLVLYLFWFVVLLPITVIVRKWYVIDNDIIIRVLQCFLFGSTFRASWFLMASLLSVIFVWFVSKRISNTLLVVLGLFLYLFCCLFSNYKDLINNEVLIEIYKKYVLLFKRPYNSFPVAVLFVVVGKVLAEKSVVVSNMKIIFFLCVSIFFLYAEFYFVQNDSHVINDDCFFSLIPLSVLLFMFIGQNYINYNGETRNIRKCSTVIYCCHGSIASVMKYVLLQIGVVSGLVFYAILFFITLLISLGVYQLMCLLSQYTNFQFVKWGS